MLTRAAALCCLAGVTIGCGPAPGRQLCDAIAKRDVSAVQGVLAGRELDATRRYGTCIPADVFRVARPDDLALTSIGVELAKAGLPADASWVPPGQSEPITAIEAAARAGNVELVRALVAVGLDVAALSSVRALVQAAGAGHLPVVTVLVEAGADLEATSGGLTALERAQESGHDDVVRFLEATAAARAAEDAAKPQ